MTKEELKISWDLESNIYNEMLNYLISLELKESELIHFTKLLGNYIEVIRWDFDICNTEQNTEHIIKI